MNDDDIHPDEGAEFSRAFELYASLDEAQATAERMRSAAGRTTGLEFESNIRQAKQAESEMARIESEIRALKAEGQVRQRRQQEREILDALRDLGRETDNPPGVVATKAKVRAKIPRMGRATFDRAWSRLRRRGILTVAAKDAVTS